MNSFFGVSARFAQSDAFDIVILADCGDIVFELASATLEDVVAAANAYYGSKIVNRALPLLVGDSQGRTAFRRASVLLSDDYVQPAIKGTVMRAGQQSTRTHTRLVRLENFANHQARLKKARKVANALNALKLPPFYAGDSDERRKANEALDIGRRWQLSHAFRVDWDQPDSKTLADLFFVVTGESSP